MKLFNGIIPLGLLCLTITHCPGGVVDLRCEYRIDPLGVQSTSPRLSWILTSSVRGERQTGYQVLVASSPQRLAEGDGDLWDSGKVLSDETAHVAYSGQPLVSRQRCYWKARYWDKDGRPSRWSPRAEWQMGLLSPNDWTANWISPQAPETRTTDSIIIHKATYGIPPGRGVVDVTELVAGAITNNRLRIEVKNETMGGDPARNMPKRLWVEYSVNETRAAKVVEEHQVLTLPEDASPLRYLRRSFASRGRVQRAVLYVTALGLYEVYINGQRVGDHVLAPDWTDYRKRVRYQVYDVTPLLNQGDNVIGALIADGWYSGKIGNGASQFFGTQPALLAQLEVTHTDGQIERVATDGAWKSYDSPVLASDFMLGEEYDARNEVPRWNEPGLDESTWVPAKVRREPGIELDAQVMEPVREICELKAKSLTEPKPGCWTFDLGQNMVGVVRLRVSAPAGTRVTLRHAEMLNSDGTIYTTNLRGAPSVDHYICKGEGTEIWQPRFTFHGFRYVELTGLKEKPSLDAVTGIVIASDTPPAGEFSCSDLRLNQLQSNIIWGQRGNYLSVPTDCPQRDERLGWMGDAQVFIRTATYNADVAAFYTKWLVDVDDGQSPEGSFADVNPNTMNCYDVPAWGDAGVICPWTIYQVYGDKRILEQHLPAMTRWIEFCRKNSTNLIRDKKRGNDYGDWLSIGADTPKELIGTAYFAYSTHLVAKSYRAVGRDAEAEKYERLFQDIKAAFNKRYVAADGRIEGDTQCVYAMALKFELLPGHLRSKAAEYLDQDIKAKGNHLSTGFVGVSYLLPVLAEAGKVDTAYDLLLQDTFPSWLFSVKHGATTIWERWDGWTPQNGFQDPGMNSFNHYALGSCGEFLFGGIGGIRPASPGYKEIRIEPLIRDDLTWAKTRYDSIHGSISTYWKRDNDRLRLDVEIPPNTTATVCLPANEVAAITESGDPLSNAKGARVLGQREGRVEVAVESGAYQFSVTGR